MLWLRKKKAPCFLSCFCLDEWERGLDVRPLAVRRSTGIAGCRHLLPSSQAPALQLLRFWTWDVPSYPSCHWGWAAVWETEIRENTWRKKEVFVKQRITDQYPINCLVLSLKWLMRKAHGTWSRSPFPSECHLLQARHQAHFHFLLFLDKGRGSKDKGFLEIRHNSIIT